MFYHLWRSEWTTVDLVLCNFFIIIVVCVFLTQKKMIDSLRSSYIYHICLFVILWIILTHWALLAHLVSPLFSVVKLPQLKQLYLVSLFLVWTHLDVLNWTRYLKIHLLLFQSKMLVTFNIHTCFCVTLIIWATHMEKSHKRRIGDYYTHMEKRYNITNF